MCGWTCSLGWFRFTVTDSTAQEVMSRLGGKWIKDKKGFLGYTQGWLSRGGLGGLGRIGTGATWALHEVHVDLSQELISDWTYRKFQEVATWVFEQRGHFGRIDVALDDRNGVIDVDRVHAAVVAGQCVSHFRQSRLISGLDVGSGLDTGKTLCMGSRQRVQGLDETDSDELESELRAHFKLSWEALMSRQVSPSSPDLCEALQRRADPLQSRQIRL